MAAVHFLHMPVDVPEEVLLLFEKLLRLSNHHDNDDHRKRHDQQCHQRHLPADCQHHDHRTDHGGYGGDNLREALVEGVVYRIDIIRDPREHLTPAGTIEELERHTVDLGGNVAAETVSDIHRNTGHHPALDKGQDCRQQVQP